MMLADIDGNLLFYIIAAVIGLISWLTKKGDSSSEDQSPSPKFPRPTVTPTPRAPQQSDDERVRKFLEALGVPADKQPPPPIQRKATPPAQREPPPLIRPAMAPLTKREVSKPQPIPPAIPKATPPPRAAPSWEERSLDEEGEPTLPVAQIHLPELSTHAVPEFVTESSQVSAIPFKAAVSGEPDAYGAAVEEGVRPAAARVRALLGTPADLRAAIILREILGPAPGLQTCGTLPTFP